MEFKILHNLNDDIIAIRDEAFIKGRGVQREIEFDGKDSGCAHFCVYEKDTLLAYLRAEDIGDMLHLGRICVKQSHRNKGYGRILMNFLFRHAIEDGFSALELSAAHTAVGFYEKVGFISEGDFYLETGVPHIYMKKYLTDFDSYIKKRLFELCDREYREFNARLMPTVSKESIIGVRVPAVRSLAKELWGRGEIKVFLNNLPHTYFEENNLHAFLIEKIVDYDECMRATKEFLPYIDNWATCDMMRPKCFGKNKPRLICDTKEMLKSGDIYTVRYGLGMLMCHFLRDDFKEEYLQMAANASCGEYYINMMVAWYFAEALIKQYDSSIVFLEEKRLPAWVHNKALQKAIESNRIPKDIKEYLRRLKVKNSKQDNPA